MIPSSYWNFKQFITFKVSYFKHSSSAPFRTSSYVTCGSCLGEADDMLKLGRITRNMFEHRCVRQPVPSVHMFDVANY